jgi:hypothetical protein
VHLISYLIPVTAHLTYYIFGRVVAQAFSNQPLKAKTRVYAGSVNVGFLVNKVALGQGFLWILWFSPASITTGRVTIATDRGSEIQSYAIDIIKKLG